MLTVILVSLVWPMRNTRQKACCSTAIVKARQYQSRLRQKRPAKLTIVPPGVHADDTARHSEVQTEATTLQRSEHDPHLLIRVRKFLDVLLACVMGLLTCVLDVLPAFSLADLCENSHKWDELSVDLLASQCVSFNFFGREGRVVHSR